MVFTYHATVSLRNSKVQAYWDVPVYGEHQELRANRVEARMVSNRDKHVIALGMSCPWMSYRNKKNSENTMKYAPLEARYPGYESIECNIILDVLRGWSKDLDITLQQLIGSKAKDDAEDDAEGVSLRNF